MTKDFKTFKNSVENKAIKEQSKLIENIDIKNAVKKFVVSKSGISDNALVNLVMFYNNNTLDEDFADELISAEYIIDDQITELGQEFLDKPETIERLKAML
jgi:hypothetical protein